MLGASDAAHSCVFLFANLSLLHSWLGFTYVMTGIVGGLISGAYIDRYGRSYRSTDLFSLNLSSLSTKQYYLVNVVVYACACVSTIAFTLIAWMGSLNSIYVAIAFMGFFVTGLLPLV